MTVDVFLDYQDSPLLIGQLHEEERRGKRTVSFQFSEQWLENPSFFQFDPKLPKSNDSLGALMSVVLYDESTTSE